MTAETGTPARGGRQPALGPPVGGGLAGALGAEWLKLWTVRSTWLCLLAAVALQTAYSVIVGVAGRSQGEGAAADAANMTPPETAVGGTLYMSQFALVAPAVLSIAGEYATGSVGTTLLCVPVRGRMLAAKSLVVSLVLFAVGAALAPLGMLMAVVTMGGEGARTGSGDVIAHALAIGAYLALVSVLVIGLGAVMRSTAGTLTAAVVVLLVVPVGLMLPKADALVGVANLLPGPAGLHLMYGTTGPYGRGVALALLAAWAGLAHAAGHLALRRRDV
ncbi:ABC transporter permease [Actinomadura roseirufa]|uniref:ABC transporter permease n=1 Tax=Actinomadura roseirufa TaxID=2094049 RepID=UPI0010419289|nr:ABC transporter permease [Actinomadura roseirufa]